MSSISLSRSAAMFAIPIIVNLGSLIHGLHMALLYTLSTVGLGIPASPKQIKTGTQNGLDERLEVIRSLRGKQVRIPDLQSLFEAWPNSTNEELPNLRLDVERTLEKLFQPGKRRSKLLAADPALFAAMWWPYASFERLCMATYLSIWLFAWDDETDSLEFSDLAINLEAASSYRAVTLARNRAYLGLDQNHPNDASNVAEGGFKARNSILEQFAPVGDEMMKHCTLEQRKRLMEQIELFIDMSRLEQEVQLEGNLPSVESYQRRRMGTSAVAVCLAIHEYTLGIQLPTRVMTSSAMKALWDATNIIISVVNDILSIKKEVAQNQVDSLIPLLYIRHNYDIQAAVNEATEILKEAIERFEDASRALITESLDHETTVLDIEKYITSCRYACTANLEWSLCSGRYRLNVDSLRNGVTITI